MDYNVFIRCSGNKYLSKKIQIDIVFEMGGIYYKQKNYTALYPEQKFVLQSKFGKFYCCIFQHKLFLRFPAPKALYAARCTGYNNMKFAAIKISFGQQSSSAKCYISLTENFSAIIIDLMMFLLATGKGEKRTS